LKIKALQIKRKINCFKKFSKSLNIITSN